MITLKVLHNCITIRHNTKMKLTSVTKSLCSVKLPMCWLVMFTFVFISLNHCEKSDFEGCFDAPASVPIECHFNKVYKGECIQPIMIVIPYPADDLGEIECTSSYPINLSFKGHQLDDLTSLEFVRNVGSVNNESSFIFSVKLLLKNLKAPRIVVISVYNAPEIAMEFALIRPGNHIFASNIHLYPAYNQSIPPVHQLKYIPRRGFHEIPCIANYPNVVPTLKFVSEGFIDSDAAYIPWLGYLVLKIGPKIDNFAKFSCRGEHEGDIEETVIFETLPEPDAFFEPATDKIYLFVGDQLQITCENNEEVKLEGIFKNRTHYAGCSRTPGSQFMCRAQVVYDNVQIGDSGKFLCRFYQRAQEVLKTWEIETLNIQNNSVLQVNAHSNNQVVCQSSTFQMRNMEFQFVSCRNEIECKFNHFCFDEKEKGKASLNISSCITMLQADPCIDQVDDVGPINSLCLKFPDDDQGTYLQGMVRCSAGNHTYKTNFFVGFDKKLYLNWADAPITSLIEISAPVHELYTNSSHTIGCKATKYFSDGELQWLLKGKYGEEIAYTDTHGVYHTELDYQLYTVSEISVYFAYPNDYEVICLVPVWNSKEWVRVSKWITVQGATDKQSDFPTFAIVGICATIFVLVIVSSVLIALKCSRKGLKMNDEQNLTDFEVREFLEGNLDPIAVIEDVEPNADVGYLPYDKKWEIPRERLLIDTSTNILGKGAFGIVFKGKVKNYSSWVAIKTINSSSGIIRFKGFLKELKIMIYIGKHPNIVTLIGASTENIKEKKLYIVTEFCENGSLQSYLRKSTGSFSNQIINDEVKPNAITSTYLSPSAIGSDVHAGICTIDLIRWSYQVAHGMEYLSLKKVIHADLAARNVLIDSRGNAKITDFGLSKRLYDYALYVKNKQDALPWRWMAIESLKHLKFSTQSDIWAYGILLWEIYSIGDVPYPGIDWGEDFVQKLVEGLRLVKPTYCTNEIYNLMLTCWDTIPEQRPSFGDISNYFQTLMETLIYVELEQEFTQNADSYLNTVVNS